MPSPAGRAAVERATAPATVALHRPERTIPRGVFGPNLRWERNGDSVKAIGNIPERRQVPFVEAAAAGDHRRRLVALVERTRDRPVVVALSPQSLPVLRANGP